MFNILEHFTKQLKLHNFVKQSITAIQYFNHFKNCVLIYIREIMCLFKIYIMIIRDRE